MNFFQKIYTPLKSKLNSNWICFLNFYLKFYWEFELIPKRKVVYFEFIFYHAKFNFFFDSRKVMICIFQLGAFEMGWKIIGIKEIELTGPSHYYSVAWHLNQAKAHQKNSQCTQSTQDACPSRLVAHPHCPQRATFSPTGRAHCFLPTPTVHATTTTCVRPYLLTSLKLEKFPLSSSLPHARSRTHHCFHLLSPPCTARRRRASCRSPLPMSTGSSSSCCADTPRRDTGRITRRSPRTGRFALCKELIIVGPL
jgi:hypothetical protein